MELADGRLLLAWSRFSGSHDNARASIIGLISTDGGDTWGEERTLIDNSAGLNVMSPALRRLPDGDIGMLYNFRDSVRQACRHFRRSDDEGTTWSEPVIIADDGYKTGGHDRFTVLSSGRLIAPLHCTDDWDSHYLYGVVNRSDDGGRSWQSSDKLKLPRVDAMESGIIEPDVVERADGSLLLIARTAMGSIYRAESQDSGVSWHNLRSMEVVAPIAPSIIRRIPESKDLLLLWNWHYDGTDGMGGKRRRLSCALSRDGGESWPIDARRILEDDPHDAFSYPSCSFFQDTVMITYYHMHAIDSQRFQFDGARSLEMVRFPIEWLYH